LANQEEAGFVHRERAYRLALGVRVCSLIAFLTAAILCVIFRGWVGAVICGVLVLVNIAYILKVIKAQRNARL
jgi:hypothetical protein